MSANAVEVTDTIDLKGLTFGEANEALRGVKQAKGYVSKKADGAAGKWAFCFAFLPDEYTEGELLELIGAEYGPGDYPVQFKTPNEGGREQIRWNQHYQVQARRLGAQSPAPTPAPAPATAGMSDALALAMENQARALETLAVSIARPPPEQKTTIDFVKDLAEIKALFSDNQKGALEQFKDAMELRALIKADDGDGDTDPLSMAIKHFGPAIAKGVEQMQVNEAAQVRRPAPEEAIRAVGDEILDARAKVSSYTAPTEPTAEAGEDARVVYAFQFFAENYLPAAFQLAEAGQQPRHVAEYLVRLIGNDEKTIDMVGLVVMQDDMVERFAQMNGAILAFAPWFDDVADWLAHALWPETNPAPEAGSATIDATIDKPDGGDGNNGGEPGAEPAGDHDELDEQQIASGEPKPDAEPSPGKPGKGHNNDA